uniref:serine/threonine-protein kinase TIO-like isoform X2 n=1 Tax=Erigeron canadensis TaxID=72917 RepID=UPI001CB8F864|nr:serine/threonine-protein kinase TIO-like isoform X2 [Erigeron canadensis]
MGVENYHVTGLVGEGSFGKVYKGRRKFTGQTVAMKFILKHGKSEKDIESLRQEIQILKRLKHENVIQMLDFSESPQELCVVTEFAHGELFEVIEDDKCLSEEEVQKIAKQLVRALHYLHTNRIIHRDMKPQNILICAGGVVKLCDFGFARAMSANTVALRSIKGTPLYMAPELIREQAYNHTADLWSLGVILYELYVGQPPFYTERIYELVQRITKAPVKYPDTMSEHFRSFLTGLLNKDPQSRLTWPNLLEHPFVAETVEVVQTRDLSANTAAARDCDTACPEGCQLLDKLESDSCTAEGAKSIIQDNELLSAVLLPLKSHLRRDEDVVASKKSLRILLNLVAASAICATGKVDEIFGELICFTANVARMKKADYNDLLIKCFTLTKMLLDKCGGAFGDSSYMRHWVAIVELYKEVFGCTEDTYERLLYESIACISVITSRVAQCLKDAQEVVATPLLDAFKEILDPNVIRRVLKSSSSREVILDTLKIVSDLARIDDVFYMHISNANILEVLKEFLTHEDPKVRAMTCSAIGNMCRHSSYFYGSLKKHNMIRVLVDRCSDQDKHTRHFACFAHTIMTCFMKT